MKKIFTLLTAALVTLTSFADHGSGRITITDFSNKQLLIELDGQRYQDPGAGIVIDDLRPGYHTIQVYALERRRHDWRGIFGGGSRRQLLYNSTVLVKPRLNVCITVNRFGQVEVDEYKIYGNKRRDRDDDWGRGRDRGREYDRDRDNRGNDRGREYDRNDRYDNTRGTMDARSFEMLKSALYRESFEKSRLEIAKQTIDRNSFSTQQVREMALLFAFENNKLELVKYAYGNTIDRNNYFQLYDVFSFNSSKEELADYIRRFR